jgi:hypothetical protein
MWRQIGDAFATPIAGRNYIQDDLTSTGLCWAYSRVTRGKIDNDPYEEVGKLNPNGPRFGYCHDYWAPIRTIEGDNIRTMFAYLMAELSDAEYRELLEAPDDGN